MRTRIRKISFRAIATVVLMLLSNPVLCIALDATGGKITLRIATGSPTGVYYPMGHGIKRLIEDAYPDAIEVEVVSTSGSLENLQLIDNEQVDLALAQNDTVYDFSTGQARYTLPSSKALAIASLYTELIQIIATKKSGIEYTDQLKGRRIRTGSPPENIPNSATLIFALAGWEASDLTDIRCSFGEARQMLVDNSLDAAVITAGVPTPLLTDTIDGISLQDYVSLIPIGSSLAKQLMRKFPYFVYTEIPADTYRMQHEPVKTVGVRAILVVRKDFQKKKIRSRDLPPDFIKTLTKAIFEKTDVIRQEHGVEGANLTKYRLPLSEALYGILDHKRHPIIPIHEQAKEYYSEKGLLKKTFMDYLPVILWGLAFVVLLGYVIKYRSAISRFTQRHMHIRLVIIFVCLYVLGAMAMYFFERYNNRSFESVGESFWSIAIYVLSGFEDRYPVTLAGRITSVFILILTVFFFGAVAGRFAAAFLRSEVVKMPKNLNDHIVICNWNERGKRVITELHHPEGKPNADIVIIDNKLLQEKELSRMPAYNRLFCIHEDPIRHGTLKRARVSLADTVIVLADNESPDPDAKSAMIILALLSECKRRHPHIISEVVNSDNSQHLTDAGADETICTSEIGVGILAHCALNKQLSVVYKDLLTYTFEGNEIYIVTRDHFPDAFVGKTFTECAQMLYEKRDKKDPVVLLGIRRDDRVIMNPREHAGGFGAEESIVGEDDALIAMAFSAPDLRKGFGSP